MSINTLFLRLTVSYNDTELSPLPYNIEFITLIVAFGIIVVLYNSNHSSVFLISVIDCLFVIIYGDSVNTIFPLSFTVIVLLEITSRYNNEPTLILFPFIVDKNEVESEQVSV